MRGKAPERTVVKEYVALYLETDQIGRNQMNGSFTMCQEARQTREL